ncbi:UNVERIFIED_ORG: MFS family permease [Peribacillus simplex]
MNKNRVLLASLSGSVIEWYDFYLYGTATGLVFSTLFFSGQDPSIALLLAFATFGIGYAARPIGSIIFGHFGDRIGRKATLMWTLIGMGGSSFLIGLLPTYNQVGLLAPILLVVLRLIQGISLGGEWGGAVLLATESAPKGRSRTLRFCATIRGSIRFGSGFFQSYAYSLLDYRCPVFSLGLADSFPI